MHCGHKITIGLNSFPLAIVCFGFQKHAMNARANLDNVGLDHIGFNIVYLTIRHSW
jgi:hypothetical protein